MTNGKQDEFDRMLDAALAKYAAVEPRTGLEERVLANLRAEQARVPDQAWWRWSAIAAVAAVVVVAVALSLRSDKPSHPDVANHPPTPIEAAKERATGIISIAHRSGTRPARPSTARKPGMRPLPPEVTIARAPKLEQFPSPQPLSEQEKLLQNYVAENPEQAVLLARARTEALRQDQLEEMNSFPSGDPARDSGKRNQGTTER
jgi:hypothetical protein